MRREIFAAHPVDRGANIVIFEFYEDEGRADEGCGPSVRRAALNLR